MTALLISSSGNMYETFYENNGSQNVFPLELEMEDFPGDPFGMPAPTCGLAGGLHCALPLHGSIKSIRQHLRLHGHRHLQRQVVRCPWMGCSDTLLWMNVPRHIQSIHLGVRFRCFNCGKLYTRFEGLARHTTSLKCNGQLLFWVGKNVRLPPGDIQALHGRKWGRGGRR